MTYLSIRFNFPFALKQSFAYSFVQNIEWLRENQLIRLGDHYLLSNQGIVTLYNEYRQ